MLVFAAVTAFTGVTFLFLGYLVKFQGMVELLAGYEPARTQDKQGLANWVGGHLFLLGLVSFVTVTAALLARAMNPTLLILAHVVTLIAIMLRLALGTRRYERGGHEG